MELPYVVVETMALLLDSRLPFRVRLGLSKGEFRPPVFRWYNGFSGGR